MVQSSEKLKQNYELLKILSRVQNYTVKKEYTYNEMDGINSKPAIQRGGENLLEYTLKVPLHINFCNPEEWISIVKNQAKTGEPFDWVYNGKYMGQFVISTVEENICNRIKEIIIYAELTVTLLENPVDAEFKEQDESSVSGVQETEQYSDNSNKFKKFLKNSKETIKNNIKEAVATSLVSDNLSDAAKELTASSFEAIIKDASGGNVTSIFKNTYDLAQRFMDNRKLDLSDLREINNMLNNTPKNMISAALRKGAV